MVKKRSRTVKDTKAHILDAADDIFVRRGTDGARMQEIADRAGVNKSLVHYYFRTKADLARAVWLRIATSYAPGIFHMMASDVPLDRKIDEFVDAYFTTLKRHPYLPAYVVSEVARRPALLRGFYTAERRTTARRMVLKLQSQIRDHTRKRKMAPVAAEQFLVTMWSACVLPFAARPVTSALLGLSPKDFDRFIARRRRELPAFLKRGLRL